MTHKRYNPLFEPLPNQTFPHLGSELDEDIVSGKTSEKIHREVFGNLNDKELYEDIFGIRNSVRSSIRRHSRRHVNKL